MTHGIATSRVARPNELTARGFAIALGLVVAASLALEILVITRTQTGLTTNVNAGFDESVYIGASWLLRQGHRPYRDFVYVFPPGFLALLWPFTSATALFGGPALTITVVRFAAAIAGAANTYFVGRIGQRGLGALGGVIAAVIFATTPSVVGSEAAVLQEPFVNLAVLAAIFIVSSRRIEYTTRRLTIAALLIGLAISVKLVAGLFVIPLLIAAPFARPIADRVRFSLLAALPLAAGGVIAALVVGWRAPFEQAVVAQISRPSVGGTTARIDSLLPLLRGQTPFTRSLAGLAPALAVVIFATACALICAQRSPFGKLWGSTGFVLGGFFLLSASFQLHYGALLTPTVALVGAWALLAVTRYLRHAWPKIATAGIVAVVLAAGATQAGAALEATRGPGTPLPAELERAISRADCVVAVRPQRLVNMNRVPSADPAGRVLLDVYGSALLAATKETIRTADFTARDSPTVQHEIVHQAGTCELTLLSGRSCRKGRKDLTARTEATIRHRSIVVGTQGCTVLLRLRR